MTEWANPSDVERAAREWTEGQMNCRVYGHSWNPLQVTHAPGVYTIYQRCQRCRNERHQDVNDRGYPITEWRTRYQDGYLLRNVGRLGTDGRAVLRLFTLHHLPVVELVDERAS